MKVGLVGTGYWARVTHGAVLAERADVDLVGVWGRNPTHTSDVARELGTAAYASFQSLMEDVDVLSFAIAPDVQGDLARDAAAAGKHLLLDKPMCLSPEEADTVVEAAERTNVSSVVFFTNQFAPSTRDWIEVTSKGRWQSGWARWVVNAFADGSPYANSPWRRDKGALWDIGPHALSVVCGALGLVKTVTAVGGEGDLVHLVFEHESGATTTSTLTLAAPDPAINVDVTLWGPDGLTSIPREQTDPKEAFSLALDELLENIRNGESSHRCDVRFGAHVVHVLADAEAQIDRQRAVSAAAR